jgi:hypothetical protein
MTAQEYDFFIFKDRLLNVVKDEGSFQLPKFMREYEIKTVMHGTSNWNGYLAYYMLNNNELLLHALKVNPAEDYALPSINGVEPKNEPYDFFERFSKLKGLISRPWPYYYSDVNLKMEYSGKIKIGVCFANFMAPFFELEFLNGNLVSISKIVNESSRKSFEQYFPEDI